MRSGSPSGSASSSWQPAAQPLAAQFGRLERAGQLGAPQIQTLGQTVGSATTTFAQRIGVPPGQLISSIQQATSSLAAQRPAVVKQLPEPAQALYELAMHPDEVAPEIIGSADPDTIIQAIEAVVPIVTAAVDKATGSASTSGSRR